MSPDPSGGAGARMAARAPLAMAAILASGLMLGCRSWEPASHEQATGPDANFACLREALAARRQGKDADLPKTFTNSIGMKMVYIPPGTFMMGSKIPPEKVEQVIQWDSGTLPEDHADEHPRHKVTITKGYYMGAYEVTCRQYRDIVGSMDEMVQFGRRSMDWNESVTFVTWKDCVAFCKKLSAREGLVYRLPTEAEWEYACRAGTTTVYSFGDRWWYLSAACGPNPWGLWDMHDSLAEWCQDWYAQDYYARSPAEDPQGPSAGQYRVQRSDRVWRASPANTRSASRDRALPDMSYSDAYGFRVVMDIGQSQATTGAP